ncbi:MAG: radical SAM protein [Gammaproteobacteria bacterium]|nr:radical SAM protein [Gammaproteobacteria bacterium]
MSIVDLDLIRKYDVNGPRYTSYPTALQFGEFSPEDYLDAVAHSPRRDGELSLYFHIPFCRHLCYYCACSKIVTRDTKKAERYIDYLKREIELQAPSFKGRKVTQLHWGGGTPTFLDDEQILDLMKFIGKRFDLASDDEAEFGIEIDPRTVDAARIYAIRAAGFNRLSFGIQDFEPAVQKAVNRIQSFESTREVIDAGREAGFKSISVDLIYGLPHQTLATIANTLRQIIELSPDRHLYLQLCPLAGPVCATEADRRRRPAEAGRKTTDSETVHRPADRLPVIATSAWTTSPSRPTSYRRPRMRVSCTATSRVIPRTRIATWSPWASLRSARSVMSMRRTPKTWKATKPLSTPDRFRLPRA